MQLCAEMITVVRKFIESLYARILDEETACRVGLTAHELLDNAIRCSAVAPVKVSVEVDDKMVTVHTENRAQASDIAYLERMFAEMQNHSDPFAYYLELMKRSAGQKDTSGLGLGRIWAEADMTLSCETTADRVSIRAQLPLTGCGE